MAKTAILACVALLLPLKPVNVSATLRGRELEERALAEDFADCNGCFCVVDNGESCPDDKPQTNWDSLIPILRSFQLKDPPSLDCDPYRDAACEPPTPMAAQEGVCVVEIVPPSSASRCPEGYKYSLKTYFETVEEARGNDRYITHSNPCGVCSSLQDLAAYMEQGAQLRDEAQKCGIKGIFGSNAGINCFESLGFTQPCATMWYYNTLHTRRNCRWKCWSFYLFDKEPNVGPQCELAPCIDCDEEKSGPLFDIFAGRTRRNSGLLSNIVRPCSEMQFLPQPDPCSTTLLPDGAG